LKRAAATAPELAHALRALGTSSDVERLARAAGALDASVARGLRPSAAAGVAGWAKQRIPDEIASGLAASGRDAARSIGALVIILEPSGHRNPHDLGDVLGEGAHPWTVRRRTLALPPRLHGGGSGRTVRGRCPFL
jgi:hypothetical protein